MKGIVEVPGVCRAEKERESAMDAKGGGKIPESLPKSSDRLVLYLAIRSNPPWDTYAPACLVTEMSAPVRNKIFFM